MLLLSIHFLPPHWHIKVLICLSHAPLVIQLAQQPRSSWITRIIKINLLFKKYNIFHPLNHCIQMGIHKSLNLNKTYYFNKKVIHLLYSQYLKLILFKIIYICRGKPILHVWHIEPSNPSMQLQVPFELHVPPLIHDQYPFWLQPLSFKQRNKTIF